MTDDSQTVQQAYAEAYQIISKLRDQLDQQKEEYEKELEDNFYTAYSLMLEERTKERNKKNIMHEHILALVQNGHDVSYEATITLFSFKPEDSEETRYCIEVYDPVDDDTKKPFHDTFVNCETLKPFVRHGDDLWVLYFAHAEEAVNIYLQLCDFTQSQ